MPSRNAGVPPILKEEISHRICANPMSRLWDVWGVWTPQIPRGFAPSCPWSYRIFLIFNNSRFWGVACWHEATQQESMKCTEMRAAIIVLRDSYIWDESSHHCPTWFLHLTQFTLLSSENNEIQNQTLKNVLRKFVKQSIIHVTDRLILLKVDIMGPNRPQNG